MDEFKERFGDIVDLDNLDIYPEEWKNMNVHDLFSKCMDRAGSSLFYMNYLHFEVGWGEQEERVKILCIELANIWNNKREFERSSGKYVLLKEDDYRLLLMKWLYRFEDEVENQC